MANTNCNCSMSLLQKQCPRETFPCNRCGARLLNGGLVWGVTIPTYTRWYYEEGTPRPATPVNLTAEPAVASGGCSATGSLIRQYENSNLHAESPATFPSWVRDDFTFDWFENGPDFTFEYDGETWCSWLEFGQSFTVGIGFAEAVMDGSTVVTPGYWAASLIVEQFADFYGSRDLPIERYNAAVPILNAGYVAPDGFSCRSSATFRFTKNLDGGVPTANALLAPPYLDIRIYKP